jgi:hypothetical protein
MKCPLIDCWSADICTVSGAKFLKLPKWTKNIEEFHTSKWRGLFTDKYPSSKLLIRDCYINVANSIFANTATAAKMDERIIPMIVSGTPGTGKSFFSRYLLWRLFHPDHTHITKVPDAIVYYDDPSSTKGWLFRHGHFYKCPDLPSWMTTNDLRRYPR